MACRSAVSEGQIEDVSWSDVVKVEMHCQFPPMCFTCYQRPFLPRVSPCGHIYCFPCIWIRIAFEHDERAETCPACGRSLKVADLKRISTFQSYVPKIGDRMKFHLMDKNRKTVNSYVVDVWTGNYHAHLIKAKRRNFLHLIRKDIASIKRYLSDSENAGDQGITAMVAKEILSALRQQLDRFFNDRSDRFGCFLQKYYLQLHSHDIFLHATNRKCLLIEYGNSKLPKSISGKVVAVERFTMNSTMRDAFEPLRHLPLGYVFYFVVLKFDFQIFSENDFLRKKYEDMLITLPKGHLDISKAVGHYVNNTLSLDIKRTNIYFADELFSLPLADQRCARKGGSTGVPSLQEPISWHIILIVSVSDLVQSTIQIIQSGCVILLPLPSGSEAFFIDSLLRKYLQGDLPEGH